MRFTRKIHPSIFYIFIHMISTKIVITIVYEKNLKKSVEKLFLQLSESCLKFENLGARFEIFFLDMVQQCGSCRVQFSNSDQYRTHYQSDWHCYNLKRKVAQLPPLGLDEFETRKEKITTEKKNSQNPKEKKDKHRKERKNQKKEKKRDQIWEAGDSPRLALKIKL